MNFIDMAKVRFNPARIDRIEFTRDDKGVATSATVFQGHYKFEYTGADAVALDQQSGSGTVSQAKK